MSKITYSSTMRRCGTCTYWCGKQETNRSCNAVTVDRNERARCTAVGTSTTSAGHYCFKWQQRFK